MEAIIFEALVENEIGSRIKTLRANEGHESRRMTYILHPQPNGVPERKIRAPLEH